MEDVYVMSDEEVINNEFDPSDYLDEQNQYLLLPFTSIEFLDSRNNVETTYFNMCPHNSVAHGFIFAYKTDNIVKKYITELSKCSKYMNMIKTLIDKSSACRSVFHRPIKESSSRAGGCFDLFYATT